VANNNVPYAVVLISIGLLVGWWGRDEVVPEQCDEQFTQELVLEHIKGTALLELARIDGTGCDCEKGALPEVNAIR
jgi:hypothetical protein